VMQDSRSFNACESRVDLLFSLLQPTQGRRRLYKISMILDALIRKKRSYPSRPRTRRETAVGLWCLVAEGGREVRSAPNPGGSRRSRRLQPRRPHLHRVTLDFTDLPPLASDS
jgi:hypothetical protein